MLSNPPYGKGWKADLDRLGGKENMHDPRFVIDFADDPEFSLVTRSSDGQMMFLANKLAKMKETEGGSRIAEVHNGSSLFTGDAGQGESNIRRWIIESDWLEAIIALPNNMFYTTGIATYIWVITNRKPEHRKGRVQLIDATKRFTPRRRNLGSKNADLSPADIQTIMDEFLAFEETETSKIFPNAAFGYWKVTIDRPLRLRIEIPDSNPGLADVIWPIVAAVNRDTGWPRDNEAAFHEAFRSEAKRQGVRLTAAHRKQLRAALGVRDDAAQAIVTTSSHVAYAAGNEGDRLHGQVLTEIGGRNWINAYEPDPELRDTEQIGYEISFTRHFYKPKQLRTLAEIEADIRALETETEGLLEEILVDAR